MVIYPAGDLTYHFPFAYLSKQFVKVKYKTPEGVITNLEYNRDYNVIDKTLILKTQGNSEDSIYIYRQTPTDAQVDFADSSVLRAYDLNSFEIQLLHISEETADNAILGALSINTTTNSWDAQGTRIVNVGTPIDQQDATTKEYVDQTEGRLNVIINDAHSSLNTLVNEAEQFAQEASQSAQLVGTVATLFSLEETYNPPDVVMLPDGSTYRCLQTSTGEDPVTSSKWTAITTVTLDTFEKDSDGNIMPVMNPKTSSIWQIDDDNNIMPQEVIL